jgi:hypothetical protein
VHNVPVHASTHSAPWRVSARWLYDTDEFNEWANECDYLTADAAADTVVGAALSVGAAVTDSTHIDDEYVVWACGRM